MTATARPPRVLTGQVWHERRTPTPHRFRYRMWWADLELDHLDDTLSSLRMISTRRDAPLQFRRADYLGSPQRPLAEEVRDLVESRTSVRPEGSIRLLAHLRTLGWCFNPIALYLCHDTKGDLAWVVADVTNTPWKERHQYVLAADRSGLHDQVVAKALHVSPFMGMDQRYRFNLDDRADRFRLRIDTLTHGDEPFAAGVDLIARPMTDRSLRSALVRHPLLTARVSLGIHAQAARLLAKRVPVHPHPKTTKPPKEVARQ